MTYDEEVKALHEQACEEARRTAPAYVPHPSECPGDLHQSCVSVRIGPDRNKVWCRKCGWRAEKWQMDEATKDEATK